MFFHISVSISYFCHSLLTADFDPFGYQTLKLKLSVLLFVCLFIEKATIGVLNGYSQSDSPVVLHRFLRV